MEQLDQQQAQLMAAQLHTLERVPLPRTRMEFASPARTAIYGLEQRIAQLECMQLHTAQTSSEPSETDRHFHHEIAVFTAQLESLSAIPQGLAQHVISSYLLATINRS